MQVKVRGSGKTLSIQIPDEIADVMEIAENSVIDEPTLERSARFHTSGLQRASPLGRCFSSFNDMTNLVFALSMVYKASQTPFEIPSGDTSILADQIQTIDLSALNYDVTGEVEPSVLEQAKRILRRIID